MKARKGGSDWRVVSVELGTGSALALLRSFDDFCVGYPLDASPSIKPDISSAAAAAPLAVLTMIDHCRRRPNWVRLGELEVPPLWAQQFPPSTTVFRSPSFIDNILKAYFGIGARPADVFLKDLLLAMLPGVEVPPGSHFGPIIPAKAPASPSLESPARERYAVTLSGGAAPSLLGAFAELRRSAADRLPRLGIEVESGPSLSEGLLSMVVMAPSGPAGEAAIRAALSHLNVDAAARISRLESSP